ncbi:hypothetical protein MHU86_2571 [Fragilaria crotonensis]|nr:hypothetical protein MHU86_2571 [Fragilaria crotonensis]
MHKVILLFAMVDLSAYAFAPPAQPGRLAKSSQSSNDSNWLLVPSNVYVELKATSRKMSNAHEITFDKDADLPIEATPVPVPTASSSMSNRKKQSNRRHEQLPRFGNLPDIYWRAISMDHLRMHPKFDALPAHVGKLDCLEDVRNFRQDSWQWDALHAGRCTTSQASAALGFLEPEAAAVLQIPKSWQRGGVGAYHRMREGALRTLNDMQEAFLVDESRNYATDLASGSGKIWTEPPSSHFPFAAQCLVRTTPEERRQRRARFATASCSVTSIKMMWGSAQEATSLLTALNYFYQSDPGVRLEEVGMCGAGLAENNTFLLGASPDALLRHSNGTREVLEVKNHCPFFSTNRRGAKKSPMTDKNFAIKSFAFSEPYLQPMYVPQLMMEMLCTDCQSAVMVRQTATTGALIIRLHRNDDWIKEMLYWLHQFHTQFVEPGHSPPANFFWNEPNATTTQRYRAFVRHTYELAGSVQVLAHVEHKDIQRISGTSPNTMSLFMD